MNKKILFILAGSAAKGGMYNYLLCWLNEVDKSNSVGVLASEDVVEVLKEKYFTISLPYDLSIEHPKSIYKKLSMSPSLLLDCSILNKIKKFNPDYIHIVDETIFFPFFIPLLYKINIKTIITIHDPKYHPGQFRSKITRVLAMLGRLSYFFCPKLQLHFHGKMNLRFTLPYFYPNKIFIPHPLPPKLYKTDSQIKRKSNIVVSFMGRIEPYKGIDLFLDAICALQHEMNNLHIKIIGRGDIDENKLSKIICKKEIIQGFVDDVDFHKHMSESDIVVLPYITATQSGVGYLAKAYSKIIVCTPVGNLPDLISSVNDGEVTKSNDLSDIVFSIRNQIKRIQL